jgi:hypothetical protein
MKDGKIIEDGSHDELIRLKGKYCDLWGIQKLAAPTAEPSTPRSRSPHKDKAVIINDPDLRGSIVESPKVLEEPVEDLQKGDPSVVQECHGVKVSNLSSKFISTR